jgi:conjugal transfer pilus assembly protein TraA
MNLKKFVPAGLALAVAAGSVFAGTDTSFTTISDKLTDWSQGSLGKVLAGASFLIGMGMGIARQSIMAAATGVGTGLVLNYSPSVINTVFTGLI